MAHVPQHTPPYKHLSRPIQLASVLIILAGLWLFLSPWLLGAQNSLVRWNFILVGASVAVLSSRGAVGANESVWRSWVVVGLGLWLVLSPWVLPYAAGAAAWNALVVGALVAVLGLWSASSTDSSPWSRHHQSRGSR